MQHIKRALISVSDKTGIAGFAGALQGLGIEIVSTGGTAALLAERGIAVVPVERVTGFPEMMDGRVKTLHPKIHGALLGLRDHPGHARQAEAQGIGWIDLVVVNLYPFEAATAREDVSLDEAIEHIDIGGPAMLRSAAKNHRHVAVVTDPADYETVLHEIKSTGGVSTDLRWRLAVKAFRRTADYDAAIDRYLSRVLLGRPVLRLAFTDGWPLRYGENSHQKATFYIDPSCAESSAASAEILGGKEMSFNNYVDADAALEAVKDLRGQAGVAVVKHTNPCGYAVGATAQEALERAWAGDPVSAFGSVIACNVPVTLGFAEYLKGKNVKHVGYVIEGDRLVPRDVPGKFVEALVAPAYETEALDLLSKTASLRILRVRPLDGGRAEPMTYRKITGGMLEMERDLAVWDGFREVTDKRFDASQRALAEVAVKACKHTKSNAIVLAREYRTGFFQVIGMGAGQPNRVDAMRKLAVSKAVENLQIEYDQVRPDKPFAVYCREAFGRMVMASDAFFPFDDTVRAAAAAGIRMIVQPGGSLRDDDSVRACNTFGMAMAFTGLRHFRH